MIDLVLTACIIAQPSACKDHHILLDSDITPLQCTMGAQPTIANWGMQHPEWFVQRWKCEYPKKGQKDI